MIDPRFTALTEIDRRLTAAGFLPLPPWWLDQAERFYASNARTWVARVGRGGVKSGALVRLALAETLAGPFVVPAGERHAFAFISISKDEAGQRLAQIEAALRALGVGYSRAGEVIDLDDLPRGFRVLSCTVAATSGFRCIGAALDELAKWRRDESGVNVDREVIASIRAMTVTHDAARLFGFSSPLVREGWHHEQVHRGTTCEVFVSRGATWQANPAVSREATMKLEPDRRVWAREYLAEPADAVTSPFEQGIDHLVARGLRRRPPVRGLKYGLRFDVGLRGDRTGILVYHSELRSRDDAPPVRVLVIDHAELLKPSLLHRVSLDDVEKRIVAVARDYFVTEVGSDLSYADALAPRLRSRGLRHVEATMGTAAQEKRSAALMSMVATGSIDLLDDRDLLAELRAVELRLSGGRWLITAPDRRGAHDDLVDCLLLAVEHAAKLPASGGDTEIEYGPVLFRPQTDRVLSGGEARYFRRLANGVRIPVDPPEGTREAEQARATRLAAGMFTAADVAALGEEEVARRINVGVE